MHIANTVVIILAVYFFLVFVVLRLVVPYMRFSGFELPAEVPGEIKNTIAELEQATNSQQEYLQAAYNFVVLRWHAGRLSTLFYALLAFRKNLSNIWSEPGYAHCNTQNYILFILLTESKFFKSEDIELKTVFFNFFIHQYLKVKVGELWVNVDPAGASIRGAVLGQRIRIFG